MNLTEIKQQIKSGIKSVYPKAPKSGGQSCGMIIATRKLISEELDITIEVGFYKQPDKNVDLATKMFDFALNELIK